MAHLKPTEGLFWALLAGLTALRVAVLVLSPLELQYDEAQYWFWSLTPDWGYFSKPPLIAWAIALTTGMFGDAEWAVRLSAPLAQSAAAAALFFAGRAMFDRTTGFWAGLTWALLPSIWLSSSIMSTDALLLPLWSLALLALWRLHESGKIFWALTLGLAIGAGALAKYAMLYFLLCAAFAALWAPALRKTLLSRNGALALTATLLVLAPNLAWNARNSFATIEHTAANSGVDGVQFDVLEVMEFLGAQFVVFGPILFVALVFIAAGALRQFRSADIRTRFLLAFAAPPLLIIIGQALLAHANANWAVTAYPAATLLVVSALLGSARGRWGLGASTALHGALGAFLIAVTLSPGFANRVGLGNALEDSRGWRESAAFVAAAAARAGPLTAIAVDHRAVFFELTYYWRRAGAAPAGPLRMWVLNADARNHAELVAPLMPADGARVLFVHAQPRYLGLVRDDFRTLTPLDARAIALGGGQTRPLALSLAEDFRPLARDRQVTADLD